MVNTYYKGKLNLSKTSIQIIAVTAMLIDHTAWKFFPGESLLSQIMHFIGRFTMPLMCYMIGEGFEKTSDINKYLKRMVLFSLISHFPYQYYKWGYIPLLRTLIKGNIYSIEAYLSTGVIYTLTLGLLSLIVIKSRSSYASKFISLTVIIVMSEFGDYGHYGILWIIIFYLFKNNKNTMMFLFTVTCAVMIYPSVSRGQWFPWGVFVPLIFINLYNGEKGSLKIPKNFFYIFYPLHMVILMFIKKLNSG